MAFNIVHSRNEHDKMCIQSRWLRQIEQPARLRVFQHVLEAQH